jgi:ribosomal protein L31E
MIWHQGDRYHLVSDCGRYTVAKVVLDKTVVYEAWERGKPPQRIGARLSAEDAKALAEAQARLTT